MKVHVYGNTLNHAYHLTKFLRAKGIDAQMFLDNTSPYSHDFPWWEDPFLSATNLPDWIHYYPSMPFFLFPNKLIRKMIRDFSHCDVALVSCFGPIVAMKAKVPFVLSSIGSDLDCIDINLELTSLIKTRISLYRKFMRLVKIITYTPLQKKAIIKYASRIMVAMGYQVNQYINQFDLQDKLVRTRIPYDVEKYQVDTDLGLANKYKSYDIIFFMISRHSWKELYGDLKGNDKFIKAFARFAHQYKPNVKLVLLKKGVDASASESLIKELGIEAYVEWKDIMNKDGIKAFESIPNCVIVDQFWHDEWHKRFKMDKDGVKMGFGFAGIEALSSGRPLLTGFYDKDFYGNTNPPILSAFTIDEIYLRLVEVYRMTPEQKNQLGEAGRVFAHKWHKWDSAINLYIDTLQMVMNEAKEKEMKNELVKSI